MKRRIMFSVLAACLCGVILFLLNFLPGKHLEFQVLYEQNENCQIFWGEDEDSLNETNSVTVAVGDNINQKVWQEWKNTNRIIRIDFGATEQSVQLQQLCIANRFASEYFISDDIIRLNQLSLDKEDKNGTYQMTLTGEDPYLLLDGSRCFREADRKAQRYMRFLYVIVSVMAGIFIFWQYQRAYVLILWAGSLIANRGLIFDLAVSDFKTRYASSYLGAVWAFVQPIVTVAIYVLVFGYGFHSAPMDSYPFVPWLVAGIIAWFYFQDSVTMATSSLAEYSYLVKKVVFEVKILPLVKIVAAFLIHVVFLFLAVLIHLGYGYAPDLYYLQLVYYCFCITMLALGVAYLTAALNVFLPDLQQIVSIILQFGIWLTPIMWNSNMFGSKAEMILKANPMYYVVSGYRDCFFSKVCFWEKPGLTIYFWGITGCFFIVGAYTFQKLEKHFADVI